jgi:mono/diheme cytochrome c family protein
VPLPELEAAKVAAGADLYAQSCASCHGADLTGDPDWQVMNVDGSFPPPPQDSSGHTWHHGDDLLVEIILDGSEFPQSRMRAFGGKLTEAEVLSILEFFKSTWGPQERTLQWEVTLRERGAS